MRIVFVRHGEPNYENDTLTEKGWREAELAAKRIIKWNVTDFYCSPLGRAKDTASCTLKLLDRKATTLPWMREFSHSIDDPTTGRHSIPWDFVPSYWTNEPLMYDIDKWVDCDVMKQNPQIAVAYKEVCENFDKLLASYGYIREDNMYRMPDKDERFIIGTVSPEDGSPIADNDSDESTEPLIVIFCHLGITCVVLSHLLNIPFPLLAHGFFLPTTSLTVVTSEEHWSNEAYFRVQAMGDVHHLLAGDEPISSAGSFAKAFQD